MVTAIFCAFLNKWSWIKWYILFFHQQLFQLCMLNHICHGGNIQVFPCGEKHMQMDLLLFLFLLQKKNLAWGSLTHLTHIALFILQAHLFVLHRFHIAVSGFLLMITYLCSSSGKMHLCFMCACLVVSGIASRLMSSSGYIHYWWKVS